MTARDLKILAFYLGKAYVVAVVFYCVYLWTNVQTYHTSIRTVIALLAFAVLTLLPERFAKTRLSETLVMIFGIAGTTILLLVVQSQQS